MAPTVGDIRFVDTNVLLVATDESRRQHRAALQVLAGAGPRGARLAASGQVMREYLAVATRSAETNGLGLAAADALANVEEFLRFLHLCEENEAVSRRLRELVQTHDLRGRQVHDAGIAATMSVHGLESVITENEADFALFEGIRPVSITGAAAEQAQSGEAEDRPRASSANRPQARPMARGEDASLRGGRHRPVSGG